MYLYIYIHRYKYIQIQIQIYLTHMCGFTKNRNTNYNYKSYKYMQNPCLYNLVSFLLVVLISRNMLFCIFTFHLVPAPHPSPKLQTAIVAFCRLVYIALCSGFSHFGRATPKLYVGKCPFPKAANVPKIALSQRLHMPQNQHFPKCFPPALFQMLLLPGMQ